MLLAAKNFFKDNNNRKKIYESIIVPSLLIASAATLKVKLSPKSPTKADLQPEFDRPQESPSHLMKPRK